MKLKALAALIATAALTFAALSNRGQPPVESAQIAEPPPPVVPNYPSDQFLAAIHGCVTTLLPDSRGVGGNPLRYDAMKVSPRYSAEATYELPEPAVTYWHIRIEEDHPHTSIPNGAELILNSITGHCSHAPMD